VTDNSSSRRFRVHPSFGLLAWLCVLVLIIRYTTFAILYKPTAALVPCHHSSQGTILIDLEQSRLSRWAVYHNLPQDFSSGPTKASYVPLNFSPSVLPPHTLHSYFPSTSSFASHNDPVLYLNSDSKPPLFSNRPCELDRPRDLPGCIRPTYIISIDSWRCSSLDQK